MSEETEIVRKKSNGLWIIIGIILTAITAGALVYVKQQDKPVQVQAPPAVSRECRTSDTGKEYCNVDYIGLSEADAISKAQADGLTYRIVARDGESFPVTLDFNAQRLNFTITNGKVTNVTFG